MQYFFMQYICTGYPHVMQKSRDTLLSLIPFFPPSNIHVFISTSREEAVCMNMDMIVIPCMPYCICYRNVSLPEERIQRN